MNLNPTEPGRTTWPWVLLTSGTWLSGTWHYIGKGRAAIWRDDDTGTVIGGHAIAGWTQASMPPSGYPAEMVTTVATLEDAPDPQRGYDTDELERIHADFPTNSQWAEQPEVCIDSVAHDIVDTWLDQETANFVIANVYAAGFLAGRKEHDPARCASAVITPGGPVTVDVVTQQGMATAKVATIRQARFDPSALDVHLVDVTPWPTPGPND